MQFYNTMTRRKEPFTPVRPGKVGLYACGITAYALSHIGHARSAVEIGRASCRERVCEYV